MRDRLKWKFENVICGAVGCCSIFARAGFEWPHRKVCNRLFLGERGDV